MAISITDITTLGNIVRERNRITNRIISASLPLTNTSGTRNVNLLGKKRLIIIQAILDGSNAEIATFIADIEEWNNNGVQSTRTYTNSFGVTYNVICTDFEWDYTLISIRQIAYSMELVEGGTIS